MNARRTILLAALVALAAPLARAGDGGSETEKHLGPEVYWLRARLEYRGVGADGGSSIAIEGSGRVAIQLVGRGQTEGRWTLPLERKDALALFRLCCEHDPFGDRKLAGPGPREEGASLTLRNAAGLARTVQKGPRDVSPAFDSVVDALRALEKLSEGKPFDYSGRYDPGWRAFEAILVTAALGAGPDPSFELVASADWDKVRGFLADLPDAEKPKDPNQAPTGYRGVLLTPRAVAGLPRWITVLKGTIQLGEKPQVFTYKKDAKGLEGWLRDEARKRGIEVPK